MNVLRVILFVSAAVAVVPPTNAHSGNVHTPDIATRVNSFLTSKNISYVSPHLVIEKRFQESLKRAANRGDDLQIWVFFTDKGANASSLLKDEELKQQLLERSRYRRLKVGRDKLLFIDLPVEREYLITLESIGAQMISVSRWFNGAAFKIAANDFALITQISELPFVLEIRPCARGIKNNIDADALVELANNEGNSVASRSSSLNYGTSLAQLVQIGAADGHDSGYTGAGVTIAMLDTGYRTSHEAFSSAFSENRVIGEWDFVNNDGNTANEVEDPANQWDHGTITWSTAGGAWDGKLYGPAYKANFLIAKTDALGVETVQEEYDWIAALEWTDSLGGDVVSSSLVNTQLYGFSDLDGATVLTSIAASIAADLGIIVCNGIGNSGPNPQTLLAPSDGLDMLAVGAVNSSGVITSFSSRGPTFDGRMKPEVCARGLSTVCAGPSSDVQLITANGTSLSTPLVAGVCAQLIQARPLFPPRLIMRALMETASHASTPDNTYGHGVVNLSAALRWGVDFSIDSVQDQTLVAIFGTSHQFSNESELIATDWSWSFGDGNMTSNENQSHSYAKQGIYDVALTIQTEYGDFTKIVNQAVLIHADSLVLHSDTVYAGQVTTVSVELINTLALDSATIPLDYSAIPVTLQSVEAGQRLTGLEYSLSQTLDSIGNSVEVSVHFTSGSLAAGSGEILKFNLMIDEATTGGTEGEVLCGGGTAPLLISDGVSYSPLTVPTLVVVKNVLSGDANRDGDVNIGDATFIIKYIFQSGETPPELGAADANCSGSESFPDVNIGDVTFLIKYIFQGGPAPGCPPVAQ